MEVRRAPWWLDLLPEGGTGVRAEERRFEAP